ncbi:MAG: two-component sensor histidine kinase [Planctomycetes bacterium]|nr:two-component sensor histidine kinase [Planctomycetota bacterium]
MSDASIKNDDFSLDLAAESITVGVRWIGLGVGYALVNLAGAATHPHALVLNAILTLGAVYAVIDSVWSYRGKVFLSRAPIVISLMEAVFIGLLCYFDNGSESPFRFYYLLSLLVCAIRYSATITYSTFALHALSFTLLSLGRQTVGREDLTTIALFLFLMAWVTWAGTALAGLMKRAERRLSQLNRELQRNQTLLEQRIDERTKELQQSQALLVQQEKQAAFGLLAAGIAHEVGNPLAAISSLVQMLNRKHHDEYTRERLQMVDEQLLRIQRTLRELVDFSRPANTAYSLYDIHDVIDAALNIAKYYKRKKGKKFLTRYETGLPRLRCVRDQLVQVFLNLILTRWTQPMRGAACRSPLGWKRVGFMSRSATTVAESPTKTAKRSFSRTSPPNRPALGWACLYANTSSLRWSSAGSN